MKKKVLFLLTIGFLSIFFFSCGANKKAQQRADDLNKSMTDARNEVYSSVIAAKNDKNIDSTTRANLKKLYSGVQKSFNTNFEKIAVSTDSNKLDQYKCAILNYKRVIAPYESDFKSSSDLANKFNRSVRDARSVSTIGITDVTTILVQVFTALAKEKIKVCKGNIISMEYKDWDDITSIQ